MKWIAKCLFGNWLVIDEENNCLVEISGNEKNAKLIAASPEILEMLIKISEGEEIVLASEIKALIKKVNEL